MRIARIPWRTALAVVRAHHYLPNATAVGQVALGVFIHERLVGVALFGQGARSVHRLFTGTTPGRVLTLLRFWMDDGLPRNSESQALGLCLSYLRSLERTV